MATINIRITAEMAHEILQTFKTFAEKHDIKLDAAFATFKHVITRAEQMFGQLNVQEITEGKRE